MSVLILLDESSLEMRSTPGRRDSVPCLLQFQRRRSDKESYPRDGHQQVDGERELPVAQLPEAGQAQGRAEQHDREIDDAGEVEGRPVVRGETRHCHKGYGRQLHDQDKRLVERALLLFRPPLKAAPEGDEHAGKSGRTARYVFGVWIGIAVASGIAALLGYVLLGGAPPEVEAVITAIAAGAILTMIADTMIPEAFENTHAWTGLITTVGFLTAFAISVA